MARSSELSYRLGTCRSGRVIEIPHSLTEELASSFIEVLPLNDQVDFFCVTEHKLLTNERSDVWVPEAELTTLVNLTFRNKLEDDVKFKFALEALGLKTSPDYVRFGRALSLG